MAGSSPSADPKAIQEAIDVIRAGGLVVHATEGVWGFACDPFNERAVQRILDIKLRPVAKGLIVIGASAQHFEPQLKHISADRRAQVMASWPGRHTWVLPDTDYPAWITGGSATIACRVPGHAQARALAAGFGSSVVSTSANRSGEAPVLSHADAITTFAHSVDYVLAGAIENALGASVIHDLDGQIVRTS